MKLKFRLPFTVIRRDLLQEIKAERASFDRMMASEKENLQAEYRKMLHGAYAGIVCDVCKKNVFRGEVTWVHGNGGKAYCLDPCWKDLTKESK